MAYTMRHTLLTGCATMALSVSVVSEAAASLSVTTKIRPEYARIMFTWDQKVKFNPSANGKTLTIRFNKAGTVPLSRLKQSLSPYISAASQSKDKKTVTLRMNEAYKIRSFVSGTSNGVDVLLKSSPRPATIVTDKTPLVEPKATTAPSRVVRTAKATQAPTPTLKKKAEKKQKPKPIISTKVKTQVSAKTSTKKAAKAEKILTTKTAFQPIPKLKPEAEPVKKAEDKKIEVATKAPPKELKKVTKAESIKEKAEALVKATKITKAEDAITPEKMPPLNVASKDSKKKMLVSVKNGKQTSQLYFGFDERTATAAFERGDDTYLVFSKKRQMDTKRLNEVLPDYIKRIEQIPSDKGTVLRIIPHTKMSVIAHQTGRGYEWLVNTSRRSQLPKQVIAPDILSKPPVKPHIFLKAMQTSAPITFTQSSSGEIITAIPSYAPKSGVFPQRVTPEATMLRTGQGIAYVAHSDNLRLTKLRSGLRLSSLDGMDVSRDLAALNMDALIEEEAGSHSFFPYASWKAKDIAEFYAREQLLLSDIAIADSKSATRLRHNLVKLYMSEAMFNEALGLLDVIQQDDKDYYEVYQLAALEGAANFMAGRVGEAAQSFNRAELAEEDEIKYWKRLVGMMQGDKKALSYFGFNKQYAQNYSPAIRKRIAVLTADNALSQKKYNTVTSIINHLGEEELLDDIKNYTNYMVGRIHAESGNLDDAKEYLEPLIADINERFLRARASFTLATSQYKAGEITRPELIKTLEPLRNTWRGDGFELNLLNLLGELYVNNQQYIDGLRAWREAISHFPETAVAQDASARMASTFIDLFNKGKADDLMPLGALALYYEFRELTPLGNEGDKMIQNLADRLAGVDLLDKAASLLEHQVTFRLEKEERSRIGARLALIYLLNREPKKTLDVLELTGYGDNEDALTSKRNHLAAISYAKTGDWQTALNLLKDDYSDEAKYITLDIFWENKDWDKVTDIAEDILTNREDITAPLTTDQTRALLQVAIAYTFKSDAQQLQYLKDYFTPLVTDSNRKQTFEMITSGIDPVSKENIALLSEEMTKLESYLDNYRINLAQRGLSTTF